MKVRLAVLIVRRVLHVAACLVHRLRLKAEVSHHRNADVHQPLDDVENRTPSFELHGRGSAFLK